MSVPLAYIGVIIIWSTTPLAIKWSGDSSSFLFGVTARMVIGLMLSTLLMLVLSRRMTWTASARKAYLVAGIAIYGSMLSTYWGSQFISSGFISVIFGLNPIMTGVMAALWLNERSLTASRIVAVMCGIAGLVVIFGQGMHLGEKAVMGIGALLVAVTLHSLSSVWFKKLNVELSALEITHGGLMVSVPLYLFTWFILHGVWPEHLTMRSLGAIVYLGAFGSVLGFIMFFYILKHIEASQVALITLITPVVALYLGYALNSEIINSQILLGTGLILTGMTIYYWSNKFVKVIYAE